MITINIHLTGESVITHHEFPTEGLDGISFDTIHIRVPSAAPGGDEVDLFIPEDNNEADIVIAALIDAASSVMQRRYRDAARDKRRLAATNTTTEAIR